MLAEKFVRLSSSTPVTSIKSRLSIALSAMDSITLSRLSKFIPETLPKLLIAVALTSSKTLSKSLIVMSV